MTKFLKKIQFYKEKFSENSTTSWYVFCLDKMKLQKKSILLESRFGEDLGGNIFYILKELAEKYNEYKIYLAYRKDKKRFYENLLKKYKIENVKFVELYKLKYWQLLATCKYIVNDVVFRDTFIKRKGQIYLNTWHGTPLKKMGFEEETRGYLFGDMQFNFFAVDYLICPSKYMSEIMVRAYKLENLFQGEIINAGYPRNSVFFDKQRPNVLREEMNLKGKKIIAYMPTWREGKNGCDAYINRLWGYLKEIDQYLSDEELFFIKLHPLARKKIDLEKFQHVRYFPSEYEVYDFLNIADCLVTDYSSVMFDFACSRRQIILFIYDKKEYLESRGLYVDPDRLPFTKVMTVAELINAVRSGKNYHEDAFIEDIIKFENGSAVENLCKLFIYGGEDYQKFPVQRNGKENVLIFVDNLSENAVTSSVFSLINTIDLTRRNYFCLFNANTIKSNKNNLLKIPDSVGVLSFSTVERTITEKIASHLYYERNISNTWINDVVEGCYKRNFIRYYGNIDINYFIQFAGYGRDVLQLFLQAPKKIVFVHDDMKKKISTRLNQHENTFVKCYQRYNTVVGVTDEIMRIAREIAHGKGNYKVMHNCFDYKNVEENAFKNIEFNRNTECIINCPRGLLEILDDNQIVKFVTIGSFSPEKGHLKLIDAFDMYWQDNKDSVLIIIGGHGSLFTKIINYAKIKPCWRNVIIIKSILNPMPILKKCNLFILSSSRYEGFPGVFFEVDFLRIPILSTDIEGPREFLQVYNGGLLVEESICGLYGGMKAFDRGEIKLLNIDYGKYRRQCIAEFETLLE